MNSLSPGLVTVVIPCFNEGEPLREAAESVLEEGDVLRELIIVDDGSTEDVTGEILEELKHRGARVIRQRNMGPSAALMTGVAATMAPFIFRLDQDDVVERGALEDLAAALLARPEAVVAWGDLQTFGLTTLRMPSNRVLDPWYVTFANALPSCSLFRRSAVLEVGGWQFRGGIEDWDLWMSLAEKGYSGIYVPRVVYRHRRDRGGLFAEAVTRFETDYEELRRKRHRQLFADRSRSRRRSPAPLVLKALLPLVDRLPGVPRLQKVWLSQLLTYVFWTGGLRVTLRIIRQGVATRVGPG